VQGAAPARDADLTLQRGVVDAFFAAARGGDFDALVAVSIPTSSCARTAGRSARSHPQLFGAQTSLPGGRSRSLSPPHWYDLPSSTAARAWS